MSGEKMPNQDPRLVLQNEVLEAVGRFVWLQQQPDAQSVSAESFQDTLLMPELGMDFGKTVAERNPESSRAAMELEQVLYKLHGCMVSFTFAVDSSVEKRESDEDLRFAFVRSHCVENQSWGGWFIWLDLLNTPPTQAELERVGAQLIDIRQMRDFQVRSLPDEPVEV